MTRPSVLTVDGQEIKLALIAERVGSKVPVHVDWLRFTTRLRELEIPEVDRLFPASDAAVNVWDTEYREREFRRHLSSVPDCDFLPSAQAFELAEKVAAALGPDYSVNSEVRKGHDFYRYRWSIERAGAECGWVGYLSSSDSPRQRAQSSTIHCNLYGLACTFAAAGWNTRLADLVDCVQGDITRCDLALDFFDGLSGGLDGIVEEYHAGACDVGGRRLKSNCVGDWLNGRERSLYFGSKEAGKQTNCYEKGHQLFGPDSGSKWLRVELRYGNKLRVLGSDMLRRPADFFAGASDWHLEILRRAECESVAEKVRTVGRLAVETVDAECSRVIRWVKQTARPSLAVLVEYLDPCDLWELLKAARRPGRLAKFHENEVSAALSRAFPKSVPSDVCPTSGPALFWA